MNPVDVGNIYGVNAVDILQTRLPIFGGQVYGEDLILNPGNFLFEYNHLRKHMGLNYETPFDKLQKVTELLS